MGEQTRNMLIGVFVIVACAFLISIILFLKPRVGNGKEIIYIRFANINKINVGTWVTYGGKPMGEVTKIQEIKNFRDQPTDELGRYYMYQLTLRVDSSVTVYNTDEVSLQTSGLLGEKSVAIMPKKPPVGTIPIPVSNHPIYANSIDPIDHAVQQLSNLAGKMSDTISQLSGWIKNHGEDLANTIKETGAAMDAAATLMNDINQQHLVDDAKAGLHSFAAVMEQAQDAFDQLQQNDTFANIGTVMSNFKTASHSIDLISQDLADGKGTIGKLIKGDDLYLRVVAVMSKIDTLMNDINHYGVLFNLNKQWQRTRTKRAGELNALNSPQAFKAYFEDEVDLINTSMSRLSMLIDRAQETPENQAILQSELFIKDFAELLRQVDELADNLRLYNEQLMEAQKEP